MILFNLIALSLALLNLSSLSDKKLAGDKSSSVVQRFVDKL
jgi:hypothetical protein